MRSQFIVGIGAQRAGTSWLADTLAGHPQVAFSPIKELHFFDSVYRPDLCAGFLPLLQQQLADLGGGLSRPPSAAQLERLRCLTLRLEMETDERRYRDYFELLARPESRVLMEITPSYSLLEQNGFEAIRRVQPEARFLFLLRDPVDRFWSQVRFHETSLGREVFEARKQGLDCLANPGFTLRSDYRRTLEALLPVVDPADVHLAFFEHLFDSDGAAAELRGITSFLGIDPLVVDHGRRVNESAPIAVDPETEEAALQQFAPVYRYLLENAVRPLPARWRQRCRRLFGSTAV